MSKVLCSYKKGLFLKNVLFYSFLIAGILAGVFLENVSADDNSSAGSSSVSSGPAGLSSDISEESNPVYLDPDRGIVRSVHIEEAWVENAFYVHSVNQDQLSPGGEWSLSGEFDFAFNRWLGGEFDFPVFLLTYPLGQGASSFGPMTLGLRGVALQSGSDVSREAGILSFELEGSWWATPQPRSFPGIGDEIVPEVLGAFRYHRVYFQGIGGYEIPLSEGAVANTFFRSSVGRSWENIWATQIQFDVNSALVTPSGTTVRGFSLIPEVAYFPYGDALLGEIGEGVSVYGPSGVQPTTYALVEVEFRGY